MKNLSKHTIVPKNGSDQWNKFSTLLSEKRTLSESKDVLPFFKCSIDLSLLIGHYVPDIRIPDCFAHEFEIYGDFVADLVVGNSEREQYLLVEFENGKPDSVFKKKTKKATPEWAPRFESTNSQLIDWFWKLEDMRTTADFKHTFGSSEATFQGLIVLARTWSFRNRN